MTITAKRFNVFDNETNLAINDYLSANTSSIYNSPNNINAEMPSELVDFINNNSQVSDVFTNVSSTASSSNLTADIRKTNELITGIKDLTNVSSNDLNLLVAELLPDNLVAQSIFNQLNDKCKKRSLNNGGLGKPYDNSFDCNGKNRRSTSRVCNQSHYSNLLNTITGGAYNAIFKNLNSTLQNLLALAMLGYQMNMCGVFNALTGSVQNKQLLSRLSAGLLTKLAQDRNTSGIMDLANGSAGLNILTEAPNGVSLALTNYKIPFDYKDNVLPSLSDQYTGAMTLFDDNWDKSNYDNIPSLKEVSIYNSDLDKTFMSKVMSNTVNSLNLNTIPSDDFNFLAVANKLKGSSATIRV